MPACFRAEAAIALGNWLRHAYDRVSFDVIWDTVENDLPRLKADVQAALVRHPST